MCRAESGGDRVGLAFVDRYAGMEGLSERLRGLRFRDAGGAPVLPEILGDGRYRVRLRGPFEFSYEMNLARAFDPGQHALASSLGPEAAVLMAGDLLPRRCDGDAECGGGPVRLRIAPPNGWQIATTETEAAGGYELADPEGAVFFLGRLARRSLPPLNAAGMQLEVALAGGWAFPAEELFRLAESLGREQAAMLQSRETGRFLVLLAPFPQPMTGLRSSGLARGRTAILLLNPDADAARTTAHLRKHLAHEMFHFYLPNAFSVRENFDWFWEGFTRYLGVLTLARLRLLWLQDYLDAVAAEYEAYVGNPLRTRVSLLDASPDKFADAANSDLVYRKGMLLAALYDWELRWQTRDRTTLVEVVAALYRDFAGRPAPLGNREILAALGQPGNFARLLRDDIAGVADIDLEKRLKPYGLLLETSSATRWKPRLAPAPKLSDRQRALWEGVAGSR